MKWVMSSLPFVTVDECAVCSAVLHKEHLDPPSSLSTLDLSISISPLTLTISLSHLWQLMHVVLFAELFFLHEHNPTLSHSLLSIYLIISLSLSLSPLFISLSHYLTCDSWCTLCCLLSCSSLYYQSIYRYLTFHSLTISLSHLWQLMHVVLSAELFFLHEHNPTLSHSLLSIYLIISLSLSLPP